MTTFEATFPVVGRESECDEFEGLLQAAGSKGTAVLVVGVAGMGKSALLREFATIAEDHPTLSCSVESIQLSQTDNPDSLLEALIYKTFRLSSTADGRSTLVGPNWRAQVTALFGVVNADALFESLIGENWAPNWSELLGLFEKLSERMDDNRRIVFLVDPEKLLSPDSAGAWLPVVSHLPPKFVFVFAQRPDDVLSADLDFAGGNVVRIPEGMLAPLKNSAADELVRLGLSGTGIDESTAIESMRRYAGWPYAIMAGLRFLLDGGSPSDLPADPDGLAGRLLDWCARRSDGADALDILYAMAICEVPTPIDVVAAVVQKTPSQLRAFFADPFVGGLLRESDDSRYDLFHAVFADAVCVQVKQNGQWTRWHERVATTLQERLSNDGQDEFALRHLAYHLLESGGPVPFIESVLEHFGVKRRLGMLAVVVQELELGMKLASDDQHQADLAHNLGMVQQIRGDTGAAEEMLRRALAIYEALGRTDSMANAYGDLGVLYKNRGDLDAAEGMYRKSLAINEALGHTGNMAKVYCNLGVLYQNREWLSRSPSDWDAAEEMFRKALAIEEALGRKEEMATVYGNLGVLYQGRRDLDAAEEMHRKALAIDEALGRKEGIANAYGNLGVLYKDRGDLDAAEEMYRKALAIDETLGRKEGMANAYCNIGVLHFIRDELNAAEEMLLKALELYLAIQNNYKAGQVREELSKLRERGK